MTAAVRMLAPAKINLALHVTEQRADGYHLLETIAVFTRFGDVIEAALSPADEFSVSGPMANGLEDGKGNLVTKALQLFRLETGFEGHVSLKLEKRLPLASGIGGGSSDAAATLKALRSLSGLDISDQQLAVMGSRLGADVAMCVHACPLIAKGIGDEISVLPDFPALHLVLANPGEEISTPEVFRALKNRSNPAMAALPPAPGFEDICRWLGETRNDLMAPAIALVPGVGDVIRLLDESGAAFSRMSGSGATCFGLFPDEQSAVAAAQKIRDVKPGWFVEATMTMGDQG